MNLLAIPIAAILLWLLLVSAPAMKARQECIELAAIKQIETRFDWHGDGPSCWYRIGGQLIPMEGE